MKEPDLRPPKASSLELERLLFFSDAVFAVSIPLALINATWSTLSYVLIIPTLRIIRRRLQKDAAAAEGVLS